MNTQKSNAAASRPANDEKPSTTQNAPATPGADMQPEDAGTPASGNANRGSPAAPVMKQFAKTDAERGRS
jgi:hypothetical protein